MPATISGPFDIDVTISDPDGDLVDGTVVLRGDPDGDGVDQDRVAAIALHDGAGTFTVDPTDLVPGDYEAVVLLTDDLVEVEQSLGNIEITP